METIKKERKKQANIEKRLGGDLLFDAWIKSRKNSHKKAILGDESMI
jgi:hypothetical protein